MPYCARILPIVASHRATTLSIGWGLKLNWVGTVIPSLVISASALSRSEAFEQ